MLAVPGHQVRYRPGNDLLAALLNVSPYSLDVVATAAVSPPSHGLHAAVGFHPECY